MFLDWSLCLVWQGSLAETDNRSLNNERVVHDIIRHCLMFDSRSIGRLYITLWHPFPGNVHQKLTTIRNSLSRAVSRLCSALTSNCAQSAENWSHSARIFAECDQDAARLLGAPRWVCWGVVTWSWLSDCCWCCCSPFCWCLTTCLVHGWHPT